MMLHHRPSRGMSIVELMIGITISLFILAAATMVATTQLGDNRRLLLEAQVQQDLRTVTDLITRDLRRAGYWGKASFAVWPSTPASAVNPYSAISPATAASASAITFTRSRDEEGRSVMTPEANDPDSSSNKAGYRWNSDNLTLEALLGDGGWQTLTDPAVLQITKFSVRMSSTPVPVPCGATCPLCPDGTALQQTMRNATIQIVGRSSSDTSVTRSVSYNVRLRNDLVGC